MSPGAKDVEKVLSMVGGSGETSYASIVKIPEKQLLTIKPMLEEAVGEIYRNLLPEKMVVADLGCSSGTHTFVALSEIIKIISNQCLKAGQQPPEVQFFLNDLPSNDFNNIFQSLDRFEEMLMGEKGTINVPHFIAGLPGSFYGRLFPLQSVHFFHSAAALMWSSQVPKGIGEKINGVPLNKGNIYIGKTSPPLAVKLYHEQFERDFTHFFKIRYEELVPCGQMVLYFLGRTKNDILDGELSTLWGLLAESLDSMVREGLVEEEKFDTFNLPYYAPSAEEVEAVVNLQGLFDITHFKTYQFNLDLSDDLDDDVVVDNVKSGANSAKLMRSVSEPLIASHFGSAIVDDLFSRFATNAAKHHLKEKLKLPVLAFSLKKKEST